VRKPVFPFSTGYGRNDPCADKPGILPFSLCRILVVIPGSQQKPGGAQIKEPEHRTY
jgi:hypothetical protein